MKDIVKAGILLDRRINADGNADQQRQEGRKADQLHRVGQAAYHQVRHRAVAIERQELPKSPNKTPRLVRRYQVLEVNRFLAADHLMVSLPLHPVTFASISLRQPRRLAKIQVPDRPVRPADQPARKPHRQVEIQLEVRADAVDIFGGDAEAAVLLELSQARTVRREPGSTGRR